VVDLLKIHLVNKTDQGYKFRYIQQFFGRTEFELLNEVAPFHDFYLHDIPFEAVNDSPRFLSISPSQFLRKRKPRILKQPETETKTGFQKDRGDEGEQ
jgi:hypothetical protein